MTVRIIEGDALTVLKSLPSESVQMVCTSPPYYSLRDYQVAGQIGLERTPAEYLDALFAIFDEVKRVMRKDATLWVNLGDSYSGSGKGPTGGNGIGDQEQRQGFHDKHAYRGIPAKSLLLIPERFAIGMQERGWIVRSRIAWCKTSAMPESVHGSFFTRHRVTMSEYETLQRLRTTARPFAVSAEAGALSGVQHGSESGVSPDGYLSSSQGAIPAEREGNSIGASEGRTTRDTGEAPAVQRIPTGANQQSQVRGDGEGQGRSCSEGGEVRNVRAWQGSRAQTGCSPEIQPPVGREEESSRPPLPTDAGWESCSHRSNAAAASGYCGEHGSTIDGSGMAGDPEGESLPLLLLQGENQAINGSRDPAEQGWGTSQGERGASVHPVQLTKEQPSDAALVDCPGCAQCERNSGLILKKGSGRPTSAWEHIWVFAKSSDYYWDDTAVKSGSGSQLRNFWLLGPEPSRENHYAAFVTEVPKRCILAGTSAKGACPACGTGWVRMVERGYVATPKACKGVTVRSDAAAAILAGDQGARRARDGHVKGLMRADTTLGWQPGCSCDAGPPVPQTVLDPFLGTGTTALVADRLGRSGIGIELKPEYVAIARRRIESDETLFSPPVEVKTAEQLGMFAEGTS